MKRVFYLVGAINNPMYKNEKCKVKYYLIFFALIFTLFEYSFSQTRCFSWSERDKSGNNLNELDSIYTDADNIDTTLITAFRGREAELYDAMKQLLQDISTFLWKNNFKWEKQTSCRNYFFFNKDGTVDFYMYFIKDFNKIDEFEKLMNEFIKDYKFPLTAEMKFKLCAPARFQDKKEKK